MMTTAAVVHWIEERCELLSEAHAETLAVGWQSAARRWFSVGDHTRGDLCQALADYWRRPFWKRLLFVEDGKRALAQLEALRASITIDRSKARP